MKKLFWLGLAGLLLFEIANVYFIMPMPGSQRINSIDAAYFLYRWRWIFRSLFVIMMVIGFLRSKGRFKRKWVLILSIAFLGAVIYTANFIMAADHMFYQPKKLLLVPQSANKVDSGRLVIGIVNNGQAKAYPIRFLGFHHQVQDSIGGELVIVTYCTVCRTGRVFEPKVNGRYEKFRLVGMDHFNAMFEDATTKSWWRQATGEAVTGKLKGERLPEIMSSQTSLGEWLRLYPASLIMQADPSFISDYDSSLLYENGISKGKLTGTDSLSWKDKSWVIGIKVNNLSKAYDWNELKSKRIIVDKIGQTNVILILASDNKSFFAFKAPSTYETIKMQNDTLYIGNNSYTLDGRGFNTSTDLKRLPASQEFWHSWLTFNQGTLK